MEIIIGIVSIAIAVIGAYIAYLQLKRTPPVNSLDNREKINVKSPDGLEIVAVDVIDNIKEIRNFRQAWFAETDLDIGGGSFSNAGAIGTFPLIDLKFRNPSNSTFFLKRIDLNVQRLETVADPMKYSVWPVAWEYSILLDPHKETDVKSLNISQVIMPNDADRFVVVLGHDQGYGEFKYVTYNVEILLCYNDNSSINLGQHMLTVTSPANFDKRNAIGIVNFSSPRLHEGDSLL